MHAIPFKLSTRVAVPGEATWRQDVPDSFGPLSSWLGSAEKPLHGQ